MIQERNGAFNGIRDLLVETKLLGENLPMTLTTMNPI
jgi:hypothetical protein